MKKRYLYILLISLLLIGCANEEPIEKEAEVVPEVTIIEDNEIVEEFVDNEIDEEEIIEEEYPCINIIMVGDMLLHDRVEKSAIDENGEYDYSALFEHTKDEIEAADLAIANEEVIIGGEELGVSGYPAFNAPYDFADELVEVGFDVICHGTNHALDKGGRGITNCLTNWEENYPDIAVLGIHDSTEDQNEIYVYEQNGIKIAILNYTYGTNGIELPSDMPYGVDYLKESKVEEDLKKAEEIADFTIVCPHWGTEYRLTPDSYQEKWTKIFIENGADLILGTHPHVVEPFEWVEEKESGNMALVYYSLGNYVNWTSGTGEGVSNRMLGAMAKLTVTRDENDNIIISNYGVIPLVSHVESGYGNVTVYPLDEYNEDLAEKNEIMSQDPNFSYDYLLNLSKEVLDY